ncbi:MAG: hypothetical protein CO127_02030 [Ignavibacteria bacterium CG_4_9_14_3_um_filter_36_18]|nr:hypothetical protein [Ignavibacteria bacterium]PJB01770.1 MAG: hypothetical protein CO127_02030 [Ignavibacteria bacterium CG_4_9_14_3_um_filter_36_18]
MKLLSEKKIIFNGEVVEIIDEAGNQKAKILTAPQYLEVVLEENNDIHLGEKVSVDSKITINKISPLIEDN